VQALAFLVLGGLVNFYVPPHEKLIPPITDPQVRA
jgi:hypothetical protein